MTMASMREQIAYAGFLPLFFHPDKEITLQLIQTLYDGGVRCIEYTNRGVEAIDNFKYIQAYRQKWEGLLLGVGTIRSVKEAALFMEAGADFLVSPFFLPEIAAFAKERSIEWLPGCATPTEIQLAVSSGCHLIKLFPGELLGPAFVRAIRPIFPSTKFLVTGGVSIEKESVTSWLQAGVHIIGMGSRLIPSDVKWDKGAYQRLREDVSAILEIIRKEKNY